MSDHTDSTQKTTENDWHKACGILCVKCNRIYTKKINYNNHYTKKHPGQDIIFTCTLCRIDIKNYENFRNHTYRHMIVNRYKCDFCPKKFSQKCHLNEHIEASHKNPLNCQICQKSFNTTSNLNRHIRDSHFKKDYRCDECGKILHTITSLQLHISAHKLGKYYMCDLCGTKFSRKTNLKTHIKMHDTPLHCNFCQKPFSNKNRLIEHLASHSDTKNYECEICKKFYKSEAYLKKHMKNHTEEKKSYICKICDKPFARMAKLKDHMNIHMGEKPYKCKYCNMAFTNNPNCLKHMRNRHQLAINFDLFASDVKKKIDLEKLSKLENNNGTDIDRENMYRPVNFINQNTYISNESFTYNNIVEEPPTTPLQFYQNNEIFEFVENNTNTQIYPSESFDLIDFVDAGYQFCASDDPGTESDININSSNLNDITHTKFQSENLPPDITTDNGESISIDDLLPRSLAEIESSSSIKFLSCEEIQKELLLTETNGISEMQTLDSNRIIL